MREDRYSRRFFLKILGMGIAAFVNLDALLSKPARAAPSSQRFYPFKSLDDYQPDIVVVGTDGPWNRFFVKIEQENAEEKEKPLPEHKREGGVFLTPPDSVETSPQKIPFTLINGERVLFEPGQKLGNKQLTGEEIAELQRTVLAALKQEKTKSLNKPVAFFVENGTVAQYLTQPFEIRADVAGLTKEWVAEHKKKSKNEDITGLAARMSAQFFSDAFDGGVMKFCFSRPLNGPSDLSNGDKAAKKKEEERRLDFSDLVDAATERLPLPDSFKKSAEGRDLGREIACLGLIDGDYLLSTFLPKDIISQLTPQSIQIRNPDKPEGKKDLAVLSAYWGISSNGLRRSIQEKLNRLPKAKSSARPTAFNRRDLFNLFRPRPA